MQLNNIKMLMASTQIGRKVFFSDLIWLLNKMRLYKSSQVTKKNVIRKNCGIYHQKLYPPGINISHLGKRKIIFKMPFLGDMLVSWRVYKSPPVFLPNFYLRWVPLFPTTHSNQTNFLHFRGLTTRAQKPENQRCHFG